MIIGQNKTKNKLGCRPPYKKWTIGAAAQKVKCPNQNKSSNPSPHLPLTVKKTQDKLVFFLEKF